MLSRIWSISIKEFLHLRHDWWLPAFMLIGGAMELLLIGWATSRPITNLPWMLLDQDRSPASRALGTALMNTGTFQEPRYVEDMASIDEAFDRGQVNAAVVIPPGFGEGLEADRGQTPLLAILNGAESIPAMTAQQAIEGVVRAQGEKVTFDRIGLDPNQLEGFALRLRVWFNESLSEALYTTPAELGLMLEFTVLLFAALTFSREKELGTLESLLVMPFSSLEIIVGKAIPVIVVGVANFALLLGIVHFAFEVPIRGSPFLLFAIAFGYVLVELSKGMIISVFSRTQHQAFLLVLVVGMVDFMFTGYAAPVESMPQILQYVANLVPAHHWLNILRGILLKGVGIEVFWINVVALMALGLIIGGVSLRYVRRTLH